MDAQGYTLSVADYVVMGFYFVFMLSMGWVFKRFIKDTSDYFRGGGEMMWYICGAGAFMVSFSAVTFTGMSGKAYTDGPVVLVIFVGNAVGFLINYLWFAALSRQTRAVTSVQVIRARFGRISEQLFTWLQIPVGTFYAGIWLMGLGVFVSAAFGMPLELTILVTGVVVLVMSVLGGAWSVTAGDFVQLLVLMPVTVVVAAVSLYAVGGPVQLYEKAPTHFWNWGEAASWNIIVLWVVATLLQKIVSTNSMQDASRYLSVKDSKHARKAAMLGFVLFMVGPILWFIPPMAARVLYPDLSGLFPNLKNPQEASYFAIAVQTLPTGMTGLLLSGIFAATMSSMDSGLNKNAGVFVKNFYQPYVRRIATDKELMVVSQVTTVVLGLLVILAALVFAKNKELTIFEMMTFFSGLVGLPVAVPLVLGLIIRKAPDYAGWSAVLVGLGTSLLTSQFLSPEDVQRMLNMKFNAREASDWVFLSGAMINILVPTCWFILTCYLKPRAVMNQNLATDTELTKLKDVIDLPEEARHNAFYKLIYKPVDFHKEEQSGGSDNLQCKIMGTLSLIYGLFVSLLVVIPNPLWGRGAFLFCGGALLVVGYLLIRASKTKFPDGNVADVEEKGAVASV